MAGRVRVASIVRMHQREQRSAERKSSQAARGSDCGRHWYRDRHQVFAPDDVAVEDLPYLLEDLLAHAWPIDLVEDVCEHQRADARSARDECVVAMVAAGRAIGGRSLRPGE